MIVTLLTDFGLSDHYVAAMKGVMLSICPDVQLVDISHEVTPFSVAEAAYTLAQAWSFFPPGTVHLAVVDPGVGSSRRPLLAEAGGHRFVYPDNGILTLILDRAASAIVRHITSERFFRQPVSQTFHGRDIFAPVAAHLAGGVPVDEFGVVIRDDIRLPLTAPLKTSQGAWTGGILKIDRFGNIITNFVWENFSFIVEVPFELRFPGQSVTRWSPNYSEAKHSHPFVMRGSTGFLEVSLNQGNAAVLLGAKAGQPVVLQHF